MEDKLLPEFDENEAFIRNDKELFMKVVNLAKIETITHILISKGIVTEDELNKEFIKQYEIIVDKLSEN